VRDLCSYIDVDHTACAFDSNEPKGHGCVNTIQLLVNLAALITTTTGFEQDLSLIAHVAAHPLHFPLLSTPGLH
jgi:hypothetical protein